MPDNSRRERRFNEEEVALIIKRAAELQQTEHVEESDRALSLTDVEQIAREAGIDPKLIRRAALGLDQPSTTIRPSPWLGAPTRIVFERVVDGEIPIEEFEPLIAEVRRTFGDNGIPSVLGRSLAWSSSGTARRKPQGRNLDVSVVVRGGVTTIRVEEELRNLAGGLFGGLMGGGAGGTTGITIGVGMSVFQSFPIAALMWVTAAGGFYALARTIFGNISEKREKELRGLADRLEELVTAAVVTPPARIRGGATRRLPSVDATADAEA
jgi:eukaryotic-like serine/threonine-protein kinase